MKEKIKHYIENSNPKVAQYVKDEEKAKNLVEKAKEKILSTKNAERNLVDTVMLFGEMVKLWSKREYKKIPFKSISSIVMALAYFVMPADFIPDFILITGLTDDVAVLLFVANQVSGEVDKFIKWKEEKVDEKIS